MSVFPIVPASGKALWVLGVICLVLGAVLALLAYTAYAARHSRVEVDGQALRIVGDFWGRTLPLRALDLTRARALNLDEAPDLRPRRRTFGTGLPGYASGWFRLRNGDRALVYLTDRRRVAYLPTAEGYALLLSVAEPERLIDALTRARGR